MIRVLYPCFVAITDDWEEGDKMLKWAIEECSEEVVASVVQDDHYRLTAFHFTNPEKAALFRLTWGETDE